MRIAHLDDLAIWGGGQNQVLLLHKGLLAQGVDSAVHCRPGSPLARRLAENGLAAEPFAPRFEMDFAAAVRLVRTLRGQAVDIVHAHTARSHAIARLAQLFNPAIRLVVSRRANLPVRRNGFSGIKYRAGVSHYLAISRAVQATLIRGGVAPDRISVVYSAAANAGTTQVNERYDALGPAHTIGFAGRLDPVKRPLDVVDALKHLRDSGLPVTLKIAGDGKLGNAVQERVERHGISRYVDLLGFLPSLERFFIEIDALVICSEMEGLCSVALEAMSAGVPVVAPRVGAIPEVVQDRETGLLYEPGNIQSLVGALRETLGNADLRRRLSTNGRRIVQLQFTPDAMVRGTEQVYERVVRRRR